MIPVEENKRLLMDNNEEGIDKFTAKEGMRYNYLDKSNFRRQPSTYGNLLKMKSWTQRPVDPDPYVDLGSKQKFSRRLM
jgi:hypothetical protein